MPKVTEAHRESRRDQILDAALRCFVRSGFQGTSMADVLAESGLSAGAVYSYYSGKQELVMATARRAIGEQLEQILAAAADDPVPPPADLVRAIAARFRDVHVPVSIVVQLWGEAVSDPAFLALASDAMRTFRDGFRGVLRRWAEQSRGLAGAEAERWAEDVLPVMVAVAQGYILQSTVVDGFDEEAYFTGVERVFG